NITKMKSASPVIVLLPLILSLVALCPQAQGEEIKRTCESAVNEALCVSSLRSIPGSDKANLSTLSGMAINLAIANGTAVSNQIKQLVAQTTDSFNKPRLHDCSENYETAISQLKDALAALPSKRYNDALTWIQAAMTESETCEDGFAEMPGHASMITDKNKMFQQLCG
ncbi:pectinesterase inhibitor domain-containing protein, partial [Ralstonia pseudosolanacearum]|uniref:pectinesterase inhibitor domain-containing protein n=1 Tax=Ralstonia pseudosolanacearum TaxID=1310165 RepID=UPI003CEDF6E7